MNKKEILLKGAAIILIGGSAIREIAKIVRGFNDRNEDVGETKGLIDENEQ